MTLLTRPGIYQRPVRPTRRTLGLVRRDIPVFLGFTTRGPAQVPVRIESLRQFEGVFGTAFETSHLGDAVRGFFETGGQTAYIVRVVGGAAQPASVRLVCGGIRWQLSARTRTADLTTMVATQDPMPWQDHLLRSFGRVIPDSGPWGNGLVLNITHDAARSRSVVLDASNKRILRPDDMAELADGDLVTISKGGADTRAIVEAVDGLRRTVTLAEPLEDTFLGEGVTLSRQTLNAEVMLNGQRVELFEGLSSSPASAAFVADVVQAESRFLSIEVDRSFDVTETGPCPEQGAYPLSGGSDALGEQSEADWRTALEAQAFVEEIALVAAPDLTRQQPEASPIALAPITAPNLCHLPHASAKGGVAARILDAQTDAPLEAVLVEAAGEYKEAVTDSNGAFAIDGVSLGPVELRLFKSGYEPANLLVQAQLNQGTALLASAPETLAELRLVPRGDVPALERESVDAVQQAMLLESVVGPYRIAVLDPPAPEMTPEDLLDWVAKLGRNPRAFAVGPWIGLAEEGRDGIAMQPPSGHACGAFAYAEQTEGVHRAPGNVVLRHVKSVPTDISDAIAAEFHSAGLNLIATVPGRGIRLMGGRLLASDPAWVHASVRRVFDALERTLLSRLNWAVFETNNVLTRQVLKFSIEQFLETMRRRGMFAGDTPDAAFSVRCDADLNSEAGRARGELVAEIAVAPTQPYEFITFTLSAEADAIEVTEKT